MSPADLLGLATFAGKVGCAEGEREIIEGRTAFPPLDGDPDEARVHRSGDRASVRRTCSDRGPARKRLRPGPPPGVQRPEWLNGQVNRMTDRCLHVHGPAA